MSTVVTDITATRMRLALDIPLDLVLDPDFGLESLLAVEAQIAAWNRYGEATTIELRNMRLGTASDLRQLPMLLRIETTWDVQSVI